MPLNGISVIYWLTQFPGSGMLHTSSNLWWPDPCVQMVRIKFPAPGVSWLSIRLTLWIFQTVLSIHFPQQGAGSHSFLQATDTLLKLLLSFNNYDSLHCHTPACTKSTPVTIHSKRPGTTRMEATLGLKQCPSAPLPLPALNNW